MPGMVYLIYSAMNYNTNFQLWLYILILLFLYAPNINCRTAKDEEKLVKSKEGRIMIGIFIGDLSEVRLGINEGGSIHTLLESAYGEAIMKLGKAYVDFPVCPTIHLAVNMGQKNHVNIANFLLKMGADINDYRLPHIDRKDHSDRGYPPGLLFGLGLGQQPTNSHAAFLQRLYRSSPQSFNKTSLEEWRQESGNPPLVHMTLLMNNLDGAHVLVSEFKESVHDVDAHGVTALHIAAWKGDIHAIIMLLQLHASPLHSLDVYDRSPLHYAALRGHHRAVGLLLASPGANASLSADPQQVEQAKRQMLMQRDKDGRDVFDIAACWPPHALVTEVLREQYSLLRLEPRPASNNVNRRFDATRSESAIVSSSSNSYENAEVSLPLESFRHDMSVERKDDTASSMAAATAAGVEGASSSSSSSSNYQHRQHLQHLQPTGEGSLRGGWRFPPAEKIEERWMGECELEKGRGGGTGIERNVAPGPGPITAKTEKKNKQKKEKKKEKDDSIFMNIEDASQLSVGRFLSRYFSVQRPVLIINHLFAGANIWTKWMKGAFLDSFGHVVVRTGRGAFFPRADTNTTGIGTPASKVEPSAAAAAGAALGSDDSDKMSHVNQHIVTISQYIEKYMALSPANAEAVDAATTSNISSRQMEQDNKHTTTTTTTTTTKNTNNSESVRKPYAWTGYAPTLISDRSTRSQWSWDLPIPEIFQLCGRHSSSSVSSSSGSRTHRNSEHSSSSLHYKGNDDEPLTLYIGPALSGTPLHSHNASWNLLLTGRKRWYLVPPAVNVTQILLEEDNDPASVSASTVKTDTSTTSMPPLSDAHVSSTDDDGNNNNNSSGSNRKNRINIRGEQRRRVQRVLVAMRNGLSARQWVREVAPVLRRKRLLVEATQLPGEVVFVPHDWAHVTLNLADCVSISQQFCTFLNTDHRIQPLGSVLYGGVDEHRGLGMYKTHQTTSKDLGYEREARSRVPVFDFPLH